MPTASTSTPATYDATAVRSTIDATNRRFAAAFAGGDLAAAARELYTRDARLLPPGAPMVQGRDAIAAFWPEAARQLGIAGLELVTLDLQPLGDAAREVGRATVTTSGGASAVGKYVVIWRQEDGRWCVDVDIWNMDAP